MLTQKDAEHIAKKLLADVRPGRRHDIVVFRYEGRYIAQFGIQRSSKEKSHDYISRQLFLTAKQCRELHECSLSLEQYVELLRAKGYLN